MKIDNNAYDELLTLRDWVRFGASLFNANNLYFGHGTDNAWDEAVSLALFALHLPPDSHPNILDARLTRKEKQAIGELFELRIEKRLPAPYITHEAWFAGLKFYVDEAVLVPRSSFGELIEKRFDPWIESEKTHHILDLCTGSGCIAIATAFAFPDAQIDAVDISQDALAIAKKNVRHYGLENQVRLICSNLWSNLKGKKYDLILSNPPYVSEGEMTSLPAEYQHEPTLGLFAEEEGLSIALQILKEAKHFLTEDGILMVEVGNSESTLIKQFPEIPFTWLEFEKSEGGVFMLTRKELETL